MVGVSKIPESLQTEIWIQSQYETIGKLANRMGLSRPTIKKYANPQYV